MTVLLLFYYWKLSFQIVSFKINWMEFVSEEFVKMGFNPVIKKRGQK